jgi:uroporphyrinogen decarboxylase
MNQRERFHAVMAGKPVDRMPRLYFGTWPETKVRWRAEGLAVPMNMGSNGGPQLPSMDTDWECHPDGGGEIWNNQGLLGPEPRPDGTWETLSEDASTCTVRTPFGGVVQHSKLGSSISHVLTHDLEPDRASWQRFKRSLDPGDARRWLPGWEEKAASLAARQHATCFFGGSLYGWLRDRMGVEAVSCLAYDDPELFEEMIAYLCDYFIALNTPMLKKVQFDFAYVFEDCCGKSGPLLSPKIYRRFFDRHYRRLIAAYRDLGVPLMLIDSDGKVDDLLPLWLDSGFDIVFPIEVGTWRADPAALRQRFGSRLRMLGGVDKHVIPMGEAAIRAHLEPLRATVAAGGFIPMPDHRIPPDTSLEQFQTYVRVFSEVFG